MKTYLFVFTFLTNLAFSFDPICNSPMEVKKSDLNKIFKNELSSSNELILYSVNPPTPIDWSTPGKTFKSIFRNSFIKESYEIEERDYEGDLVKRKISIKTHFIGHMFMELKCQGFPTILTGMSSPGYEEIKGLMIDGKSFTQIISTTKGHFNTSKELAKEISIRKEKVGNLNYMGIKISQNSCEELLKYITEYKACGVNNRYGGLNANPHRGEGAGCSAFSISFLQRLNIIPDIEKINDDIFGHQFVREVNVPKKMLIFQNRDPEVGAWGLLKGNKIEWAKNKEDGLSVKFFDPELFSKWVKEYNPSQIIPSLKYIGRDGNKLIQGIWFEEDNVNIEPSSFNINYLLNN